MVDRTAIFRLKSWKHQRLLYDQYGGGRVLFQQFGVEAFDAMHKWLKERESAGDFTITDSKLRAKLFAYWTTTNHGAFSLTTLT